MKDLHPEFISRWTNLTLKALRAGKKGGENVVNYVRSKDSKLEFTDMNSCYVGESRGFNYDGRDEPYCKDCDAIFAFPPEWMYQSRDSFLQWKSMFWTHMTYNHPDTLKANI